MSKKGGHHGGAWKVAYADFVTAMMALFLVLWLAAQDQKIKESVERAFRNPFMSLTKESAGILPNKSDDTRKTEHAQDNPAPVSPGEAAFLRRLEDSLTKSLAQTQQAADEEPVKFNLTDEGLRINIFDRGRKPVFEADSAQLTEYGNWILTTLAWEISRYKTFSMEVEGHTERGRKPVSAQYGGWELSADRANAGRRKLVEHGVNTDQIKKVAGFADTIPLPDYSPENPNNRRVTLLLRVQTPGATR